MLTSCVAVPLVKAGCFDQPQRDSVRPAYECYNPDGIAAISPQVAASAPGVGVVRLFHPPPAARSALPIWPPVEVGCPVCTETGSGAALAAG